MGYILPLPYFKERNYHTRKPIKQDPFYVENKYPIVPLKQEKRQRGYSDNQQALYTPKRVHAANNEKILAEITGKGRHFNEIV